MRYILIVVFLFFGIVSFGQDFKDLIFINNGDIIKCKITLVSDTSIFADVPLTKNKVKSGHIPISEIIKYYIESENKLKVVNESTNISDTNKTNNDLLYVDPENLYLAGEELKGFTKQYNTGVVVCVLGGVISIAGSVALGPILAVVGGGISIIGGVFVIASHDKTKSAGDLLMKYSTELKMKYIETTNN